MSDLFKQFNPGTAQYEPCPPESLWKLLNRYGFVPHPGIVSQYLKKNKCFYCGGEVVRVEGIEPTRYEDRCDTCKYLYSEDGNESQ